MSASDLPWAVLSQLSAMPEEAPADFECAVCGHTASNRWNYSPRDYERPPVCRSCETVNGCSWTGQAKHRTMPSGGTHRDRREAMRIAALADAISQEATRQKWSKHHAAA